MSSLTKEIKAGIIRTMNRFGYTIIKVRPSPKKSNAVVEIPFHGRTLKIHPGNPLYHAYRENPKTNAPMGLVANWVIDKYPAAWAVDVGANVGDTMLIIRSKADMPIICVEGDLHCYRLLEENARELERVHGFNIFLSDKSGTTQVSTEKEGWNMTLVESRKGQAGREIKMETLDKVIDDLGCKNSVKFVKVDTEGYDMRILRGAANTLAAAHPVLTFEINRENIEVLGDNVGDFYDYLTGLGYSDFLLADPNGDPVCVLGPNDRQVFFSLYTYSGPRRAVCYIDVWAFHRDDHDLFARFCDAQSASSSPGS